MNPNLSEDELRAAGEALLAWHARTERDLPWRGEEDPYRIWISETMLQQTRAAVAAGRYRAFLQAFPDVFALAAAPQERVLALWQGMGYYARARNLHRAAAVIAEQLGGVFPRDEAGLRALPGVGEYTACAILSMAWGERVPAVDANLARVISRVCGLRGFLEDNRAAIRAEGERWLLACAAGCPGDFNRACMGLGAMVCLARGPRCGACPLEAMCLARSWGEQEILPEKRPKAPRREEWRGVALAFAGGLALIRRRPDRGMLAALWEFPHFLLEERSLAQESVRAALREEGFPAEPLPGAPMATEFAFTHRLWRLRAWRFALDADEPPAPPYLLADADRLRAVPMPSVMEPYRLAALEALEKEE